MDESGRDVEVWCMRTWYKPWDAHYEIRVSDTSKNTGNSPYHRTVGGCFFIFGQNEGPDIKENRTTKTKYESVHWINQSPLTHKEYDFTYDWAKNKLKIITRVPGLSLEPEDFGSEEVKEVDPPTSYEELKNLLPDPPTDHCTLQTPASALGFAELPYTLTVIVQDRITGLRTSWVDVEIRRADASWVLLLPTDSEGSNRWHLGRGEYSVRTKYRLLWMTITSKWESVPLDRDRRINFGVTTMGIPGRAINFAFLVTVVVVFVGIGMVLRAYRHRS